MNIEMRSISKLIENRKQFFDSIIKFFSTIRLKHLKKSEKHTTARVLCMYA